MKVDIPVAAAKYILQEQDKWDRDQEVRSSATHLEKRLGD